MTSTIKPLALVFQNMGVSSSGAYPWRAFKPLDNGSQILDNNRRLP